MIESSFVGENDGHKGIIQTDGCNNCNETCGTADSLQSMALCMLAGAAAITLAWQVVLGHLLESTSVLV